MTLKQQQADLQLHLQEIYEKREAAIIADWVMEKITGKKRIDRLMNTDEYPDQEQQKLLQQYTERLMAAEPVQYVLQEAWFYGMKLYVDRQVLIPRPETEELVQWILDTMKHWPSPEDRNYKILDVGTGSGCIPIALKKNLPAYVECWGCDKSDAALTVARRNADDQHALVDFLAMDFLDKQQRLQLPYADIIVSNPPYIPQSGRSDMKANVVNFEPQMALFVPDDDPLVFYKALADFGKEKLHMGGLVFVEIHEIAGHEVQTLFSNSGYKNVVLKKDMQGKDRMVSAAL